jgi:hypothetical protein
VHGSDAAATDGADLVGNFVLNVAGGELRLETEREILPIEATLDSALATGKPTGENGTHLKSFRGCDVWQFRYYSNTANHQRISSFFNRHREMSANPCLIEG